MKQKTIIIAEAGVNHNGDLGLAKELIDVAAEAGADYVKFQTFSADRLVTHTAKKAKYQTKSTECNESQHEMLRRLELTEEMHKELIAHCFSRNIGFFSTGFDIESIIFSFAVGGLAAILYESIFKVKHIEMTKEECHHKRHRLHLLALSSPFVIFIILAIATNWNHIYCAIAAMFLGGIAALLCRPDLKKKIWAGGLLFLVLYFIIFLSLVKVFPGYVKNVWNLSHISGILILGIPVEELFFAFALGMLWSSLYEHIYWFRLVKNTRN